jgi:hypothetical protein
MGGSRTSVTTDQLARRVIELYWPQTVPYPSSGNQLRQSSAGGQASIIRSIEAFRRRQADPTSSLGRARLEDPDGFEALVRKVAWKLIEMPLPRLQTVAAARTPFIYRIGWDESVRRSDLDHPDFDNRILFVGDAADHLVRLAGLLRPLIQLKWADMVARMNPAAREERQLSDFLFGIPGAALVRVAGPLRDLQEGRCFYCRRPIAAGTDVDHFLPWARYPDNGIENLVAAHPACNNAKRDFLAAAEHVERWTARLSAGSAEATALDSIAAAARWDRHPERSLGATRSIYLRLPSDGTLWLRRREFVPVDRPRLVAALG